MNPTPHRTSPAKNTANELLKQENEQLRAELYEARYNILALLPEEIRQLIKGYRQCHSHDDILTWQRAVIEQLLAVAASSPLPTTPGSAPRARCPLCHQSPQSPPESGYSLPIGLQRHLEGQGKFSQCVVMATAVKLAKEHLTEPVRF